MDGEASSQRRAAGEEERIYEEENLPPRVFCQEKQHNKQKR